MENTTSPATYFELVDRKVQQEVSWIQQRMTWLATFQGLLFATFGLIYEAGQFAEREDVHIASKAILVSVTLVGMMTSICIIAGLHAAGSVLKQLNSEWIRLVPDEKIRNTFPNIRTEGSNRKLGLLSSWGPAFLFLLVWFSACIIVIAYL